MKRRLVLLGPPGSGKGTQAEMITRHFGIPVTSPGAILRRERDLGTPLGQETAEALRSGGLVSDKIIIQLIEDWLRLHGGHGFVFDGFPRTLPQAESLNVHVGEVAHCLGFGDLAGSIGGDCAGTVSRAGFNAANVVLPPAHRAHSLPTVPYAPIATGDWSAATTMTWACCKRACRSSGPRPNR